MKTSIVIILISILFQAWTYNHPGSFVFFESDNLGNLYIVEEESISMVGLDGEKIFEYNQLQYGEITCFDQTSAMRSLVFYEDQSVLLILDNTLSVQSPPVRLSQFDLYYIQLMCASKNNHYWCYSSETNSIIRLNQQLAIVSRGEDLNQLLRKVITPEQIMERNGKVYLNDPENGIHVFDTYGNFEKTLDIKNVAQMEIKNSNLFYLSQNKIFHYDLKTSLESLIELNQNKISGFSVEKDQLFWSAGQLISVFDLK